MRGNAALLVAAALLSSVARLDGAHKDRKAARCKDKKDPHGNWSGSTEPGGEYTLTCDEGYAVDGQPTVTLTCSKEEGHGVWPAEPWCENVDDCGSLVFGCGPGGLCVDHLGGYNCICENGAVMHNASNGEVVCVFQNETRHCGARNCGAHGICLDLEHFQESFDTKEGSTYRCSCGHGYTESNSDCVPIDCGVRTDRQGVWTGTTTYGGEYTLDCEEGAFVWGGSEKAMTITCPPSGAWSSHPICLNPEALWRNKEIEEFRWWMNVYLALGCVAGAALAAGLTMGLVSLDPRELEILERASVDDCVNEEERYRLQRNQEAAKKIKPVLVDHHRLLVTLLLLQSVANESLPIFLDELMPPFFAVLVSVSLVLLFGEIIPSAIFTGPMQLTIAARFLPVVMFLQRAFYGLAKPIAGVLDTLIPHEDEQLYTRPQLFAVLAMHNPLGDPRVGREHWRSASCVSLGSSVRSRMTGNSERRLLDQPAQGQGNPGSWPSRMLHAAAEDEEADPHVHQPLDGLEAQLLFSIFGLGELQVTSSPGFSSLRVCAGSLCIAGWRDTVADTIRRAARQERDGVAVVTSRRGVASLAEVHPGDVAAILPLAALLTAPPAALVGELCRERPPVVRAETLVTDALCAIADRVGTECGHAVVTHNGDLSGIFDGAQALATLMPFDTWPEPCEPAPLPREAAAAVAEAAEAMAARQGHERDPGGAPVVKVLSTVYEMPTTTSLNRRSCLPSRGAGGQGSPDAGRRRAFEAGSAPPGRARTESASGDFAGGAAASATAGQADGAALFRPWHGGGRERRGSSPDDPAARGGGAPDGERGLPDAERAIGSVVSELAEHSPL